MKVEFMSARQSSSKDSEMPERKTEAVAVKCKRCKHPAQLSQPSTIWSCNCHADPNSTCNCSEVNQGNWEDEPNPPDRSAEIKELEERIARLKHEGVRNDATEESAR